MRFVWSPLLALPAVSASAAEPLSDEKQILGLEDDWVRALSQHDRERLVRSWRGNSH